MLFASDMPFDPEKGTAYIRWTIEIINSLDIKPEQRQAIYEGNAKRIMRLKINRSKNLKSFPEG